MNTSTDSVNTSAPSMNIPPEKLLEDDARKAVALGFAMDATVREIAEETGWSVGWVSARLRELREQETGKTVRPSIALVPAGAR